jgi:CheY-like chemotaxis protein
VTIPVVTATATYPEEGVSEAELLAVTERRLTRGEAPPTRLLVVDDEPKIRQFLKEVLELREYTVTTAASGPEALALVKHQPIDCILLDLMMPVMDGYELYHLLKEDPATAAIPVLIVTAKGERKDRELGLASGAPYAYVTKPFQLEELIATLQEVLQRQAQTPTPRTLPQQKEVAHGPAEDPHRG